MASRCSSWRCRRRTCCRPPGTGPGLGAHMGPIGRSGPPGGRPALSPALWCSSRRDQGCPTKVAPTPPPPPPPPRPEQPAPRRGPGTGRLGWHRPGKSVRAKSWPGVSRATRPESAPVPPEEPQEHHIADSHASDSTSNLGCPEHPVPPQMQWWHTHQG